MTETRPAMVMTILDGRVPEGRWGDLRRAYADAIAGPIEPGLVTSVLIQSFADREAWRILTLWKSRAALEAMRSAGPPRGQLIFGEAGVEPTLSVHEVADHVEAAPD